ncbi:hypothetical protein [Bradyrhizobium sp.]|uniref:hypothetical protein n=1 Tax=Bradyrhizobium sp. TaxID=376 RepID=UPI00403763BA
MNRRLAASLARCGSMRSAIRVTVGSLLLIGALVAAGADDVSAQSAPAAPPVAVSGWRYEKGRSDMHLFHCEQVKCGVNSKVSYRIYAPGNPMTLHQYRDSQQQVAGALEQRSPGLKVTILGIDGDKGTSLPRLYKARRLMVAPDGQKEYVATGLMFGSSASVSLISSSQDQKASNDNYAQFAVALTMLVQ